MISRINFLQSIAPSMVYNAYRKQRFYYTNLILCVFLPEEVLTLLIDQSCANVQESQDSTPSFIFRVIDESKLSFIDSV